MWIAKKGENILLANNTKEGLKQSLGCIDYDTIEETNIEYAFYGNRYLTIDEIAAENKKNFTNTFFEIEGYGWFRKAPKGYSSAVEAMSAAFNMVSIVGYLPTNTLTFYAEPDFTEETQCTEEWLVTNSYKNDELSTTEFGELYAKFLEGWNKLEHKYSISSNR